MDISKPLKIAYSGSLDAKHPSRSKGFFRQTICGDGTIVFKYNAKNVYMVASSKAGANVEVYMDGNVYCASKHAVDALSKSMRMELVSHSIRVTNIAPGAIETEFSLVRFKGDDQVAGAVYDGFTPLSADDVADTIYYAASLPPHVNLNDITIMPSAQASATVLFKNLV